MAGSEITLKKSIASYRDMSPYIRYPAQQRSVAFFITTKFGLVGDHI